jgi:carbonic anhydrase
MTEIPSPIDQLLAGNKRYVEGKTTSSNKPEHRHELSEVHAPLAAILCCADSRVAPEIVFDQQLGDLFVCRIAGNVPTSEIIESLEYAVGFLGVQLIVVMGHSSCGAVTAALESEFSQGLFSQIALSPIPDLNESISHNAKQGAKTILDCSPLILDAIESGDLAVTSGVQDIASGKFTVLDCYQAHEH